MKLARNIQAEINLHQKSSSIPSGLERIKIKRNLVIIIAMKNIKICKTMTDTSKTLILQKVFGKGPKINLRGSGKVKNSW